MRLVEVARAVRDFVEGPDILVASWTGRALTGSAHVHADRARYRGLMVPRCAKRAVLFLAARIVESARRAPRRVIVAGHGDGGTVAALAAECARVELAFDSTRRVVRSVSFGAHMRYPVRADLSEVATHDTRALFPFRGAPRPYYVGQRDASFYRNMALSMVASRAGEPIFSASAYVARIELEAPATVAEERSALVALEAEEDRVPDTWIVVSDEE
jgi:hypothetical protein